MNTSNLHHKHLKGLLAKELLPQNTVHCTYRERKSQQDIKLYFLFFLHDNHLSARQASVLSASCLRCQLSAQLLRFPQQEKQHQTGKAAEILPAEQQVSLWPLKADRFVTRSKGLFFFVLFFFSHVNLVQHSCLRWSKQGVPAGVYSVWKMLRR